MAVPNTFATATSAIPLANLDSNFAYYDAGFSLSGTAVTFAGSITLTTGTANGVPYLNASKVLTSGGVLTFNGTILSSTGFAGALNGTVGATTASTGAFTTLTANSTVTFSGTTQVISLGTSQTSGTWTAGGASQTGAITLGQSTVNQTINIGTGATTAVSTKTINIGTAGVSGATTNINLGSAVAGSVNNITVNGGTANGVAYLNGSKVLTTGSALVFDGTNLGLGVTPSAWATVTPAIELKNGVHFATLNTTTPIAYFGANSFYNGSNWIYKTSSQTAARYEINSGGSGAHAWYNAPSGTAGNPITFTQAMALDATGNLLVGQTSTGLQNIMGFSLQNGAEIINHVSGTASGQNYVVFGYNAVNIGSITQSGTTAVLYNLTSDQRLKENIQDAASASDLIDAIQVRQYDWKSDGSHQRYGFVAQELVTVAPEAVHQPADPEEMMAVDYSKLVPMLVKEIQDLRKRLAAAGI